MWVKYCILHCKYWWYWSIVLPVAGSTFDWRVFFPAFSLLQGFAHFLPFLTEKRKLALATASIVINLISHYSLLVKAYSLHSSRLVTDSYLQPVPILMNMFAMDHSLQLGKKCESFCTISCSILKQLRPVFTEVACVCITYIMSYTVQLTG